MWTIIYISHFVTIIIYLYIIVVFLLIPLDFISMVGKPHGLLWDDPTPEVLFNAKYHKQKTKNGFNFQKRWKFSVWQNVSIAPPTRFVNCLFKMTKKCRPCPYPISQQIQPQSLDHDVDISVRNDSIVFIFGHFKDKIPVNPPSKAFFFLKRKKNANYRTYRGSPELTTTNKSLDLPGRFFSQYLSNRADIWTFWR